MESADRIGLNEAMLTYAHPLYAASLSEFGTPRKLDNAGASVLVRAIPGFDAIDAMGCYPFFSCADWSALGSDFNALEEDWVSLGVVADPHGNHNLTLLEACFDQVRPFKQHYCVDLEKPLNELGSVDRRKKARRALRQLEVEVCSDPVAFVDEWCALYDVLVERHGISGIRAFSRKAFAQQFALPGVDVLKAVHNGETVGALVMFWQDDVVCGHLCALSETGYRLRASYALDWFSINHYAGKARMIDLGGGVAMGDNNGLADYKQGWATNTVPVYFCGRIFNHERYKEITEAKGMDEVDFFPAYRAGEYT